MDMEQVECSDVTEATEVTDMAESSGPRAAVRTLKAALRLDPDVRPGVELLKAASFADVQSPSSGV